jgi:hypothetical protein
MDIADKQITLRITQIRPFVALAGNIADLLR